MHTCTNACCKREWGLAWASDIPPLGSHNMAKLHSHCWTGAATHIHRWAASSLFRLMLHTLASVALSTAINRGILRHRHLDMYVNSIYSHYYIGQMQYVSKDFTIDSVVQEVPV